MIATRRDRSAGALEGLARHATDSSRSSPASSTTTRTGLPSPYLQALRSSVLAMRSTRARSQTPRAGPPSTVTAHPAWSSSARRRPTISHASLPRARASGCSSTGASPSRAEASSSDSISDPRRCVWRSAVASWSASAGPDRSRSSRRMRCRSSCSAVSGVRSSCAATVRNSSRSAVTCWAAVSAPEYPRTTVRSCRRAMSPSRIPRRSSIATLPPVMREAHLCSRWVRSSRRPSSTCTKSPSPARRPSIRSRAKPEASSERAATSSPLRRRSMHRTTNASHSRHSGISARSRACCAGLSATSCRRRFQPCSTTFEVRV